MIESILFGITQGLTEFLPISSSGHLLFLQRLLARYGMMIEINLLFFFIFLHIATLVAVIIFLKKSLPLLLNKKILSHIVIITATTAVVGALIHANINIFFDRKYLLALCFLTNAGILLTIKNTSQVKTVSQIQIKDSILVGILQGISLLPGISRSGITITGLLRRGFKKEEAFTLSFLMAVPVMLGVFIVELIAKREELTSSGLPLMQMAAGFGAAVICGLLGLKMVKKMLIAEKFKNFAYYCLFISLLSLII